MASANPPLDFSDKESTSLTRIWNNGEKERATFMNADPDEIGKLTLDFVRLSLYKALT